MVYLDDILIFSKTFEEHLESIHEVFGKLEEADLRANPEKCQFAMDRLSHLGFVISSKGVEADPSKVERIQNFPMPRSVTEVRRFLGIASYYRRFVQNFAKVAAGLNELLKKTTDRFQWNEKSEQSFSALKNALSSSPCLAYPDETKPYIIHTDASGEGLGAILHQIQDDDGKEHPIAYASRTTTPAEKNYGASELEALGVVWALDHFRSYVHGVPVTVITDHSPLTWLLTTKNLKGKLARWSLRLQ